MSTTEPYNLQGGVEREPVPSYVALILNQALWEDADSIVFELDLELHKKVEADHERLRREGRFDELDALPNAFRSKIMTDDKEHQLEPAPGMIFGPVVRILLNQAGLPYWTNKEISGELETINPASKWVLESKDLSKQIQLRRIRAR